MDNYSENKAYIVVLGNKQPLCKMFNRSSQTINTETKDKIDKTLKEIATAEAKVDVKVETALLKACKRQRLPSTAAPAGATKVIKTTTGWIFP